MPESKPSCSTPGNKKASIAVAQVSGAQWGVIGAQQLLHCGIGRTSISRWRRQGRLHQLLPGVYAVGHPSVSTEGWLVAALIHAGPGAALSHATAAWWWGLIPKQPGRIEVSTLARARSVGPVAVHHPRQLEIVRHRRFPVTTVARTLLDFAAEAGASQVRRALSEADYLGLLDLPALRATVGGGRSGSARLGRALERHEPRLARTRSELERAFLALCEAHRIPLPEVNARVGRMTVDALWRQAGVVVEIDGHRGHRSRAQMQRDRRRELHLRAAGLTVIRYAGDQLVGEPALVAADLWAALKLTASGRARRSYQR